MDRLMTEIQKLVVQRDRVLGAITFEPISRDSLRPGYHIYVHRALGYYSHHGIYVGDGYVIHFTKTQPKKGGPGKLCPVCGYNPYIHRGVVKTCLTCFIVPSKMFGGKHIHYYEYGTATIPYWITKGGTMNRLESTRDRYEVLEAAYHLLENPKEFGEYDLIYNNCEDFAVLCKTGSRLSTQREKQWPKAIIQYFLDSAET